MRVLAFVLWALLAATCFECGDNWPAPAPDAAFATLPPRPAPHCPVGTCTPDARGP